MKKVTFVFIFYFALCSMQAQEQLERERQRENPPKTIELLRKMDANKDGKLSKGEVKGPLKNDFLKFDLNKDGFLSEEELEKLPPPPKEGQRPPRR